MAKAQTREASLLWVLSTEPSRARRSWKQEGSLLRLQMVSPCRDEGDQLLAPQEPREESTF